MTIRMMQRGLPEAIAADVAILAYNGVDEIDLFGVFSVLAKARAAEMIRTVGIFAPDEAVVTSGGAKISTRPLVQLDRESAVLVVPGGSGAADAARTQILAEAVRQARQNGARIYCCCSGALIVAAALQLTKGRIAIHARKRADLQLLFGGEIVSGLADSNGIVSIGGQKSESVKSVRLGFRILADLDPAMPQHISDRTEIAWTPD